MPAKNADAKSRTRTSRTGKVKKICGATRGNGEICAKDAGWGTNHPGSGRCKFHGGRSGRGQLGAAREEAGAMATAMPATPGQAVIGVMQLGVGQLAYATVKVGELTEDDEMWETNSLGIVEPNRWVRLQRDLMDRVAKYAKLAGDMGIAERQVRLAEEQTAMMRELLEGVMGDIGLTAAQRKKVGPAIRRHLATIESKANEIDR